MSIFTMITGIEELEAQGIVEEVTEAVEEVVQTEIAEATAEIAEVADTVEEIAEQVEAIDEAVEDVQETVEGMESLLNSGNFNAQAFAVMYNTANRRANVIPGHKGAESRVGVESLGDAATAQLMAREGMESMMDSVKGWGKKAVEVIKQIFNSVINFFVGLFDQSKAIERRADQLKERLVDAELVDEVKFGKWNARIDLKAHGVDGTLSDSEDPSGKAVGEALGELSDSLKALSPGNIRPVGTATEKLSKELEKAASTGKMKRLNKKVKDGGVFTISQRAAVRVQVTYPSEVNTDTVKDITTAVRKLSFKSTLVAEDADKLKTGTLKNKATKAQLEGLVKRARQVAADMRIGKVAKKFDKAERDRVVGLINATAASAEKSENKEVKDLIALVRAGFATTAAITTTAFSDLAKDAKAGLDCVAAHIK